MSDFYDNFQKDLINFPLLTLAQHKKKKKQKFEGQKEKKNVKQNFPGRERGLS